MQLFSLKEVSSSFSLLYRLLDVFVLIASAFLAYFFFFNDTTLPWWYFFFIAMSFIIALITFASFNLHKTWRGSLLREEVTKLIYAWVSLFLILSFLFFVTKTGDYFSRAWFSLWFITGLSLDIILRVIIRKYLVYVRKEGKNHRDIVIVAGDGNMGFNVCKILKQEKWTGLNVLAYFTTSNTCKRPEDKKITCSNLSSIIDFLSKNKVYQVWITMPLSAEKEVKKILHKLRNYSGDIKYIPDFYGFNLINHSFSEIAGIPIINLTESPFSDGTRLLKRFQDFILSLFILVSISPIMIAIAFVIKLTSKGPVFYKQERVSWNNEVFTMLKFRTMPLDIEKNSGAIWAKKGDDRSTMIGGFLRKTSMDELPQFFNVLMGSMSIVGPRPERPVFVDKFKDEIPQYMKKHMVKAGITGWAQINDLRGDSDLNKRIEYDIYYIEHWSLMFDIKIILLTLFKGFFHKNAY